MSRLRVALAFVALLASCIRSEPFTTPPDPGPTGILVALYQGGAEGLALAIPSTERLAPLSGPAPQLIYLAYREPLSYYRLREGPIRKGDTDPGQPLPQAEAAWVAPEPGAAWQAVAEKDARLQAEALLLPFLELPPCPGCLRYFGATSVCQEPCRPPEVKGADAMPEPPEPPALFECARGWSLDATKEVPACVPDSLACPPGERRFPGDAACAPIACPADGWPDLISALFVDPAAAPGGNGTRLLPFTNIAEALPFASEVAPIALSRGRHVLDRALDTDLSIVGACPSETTLVGTGTGALAGIALDVRAPVELRGLTVDGDGRATGVWVESGGALLAVDVAIVNVTGTALTIAPGAELIASRIVSLDSSTALRLEGDAQVEQAILGTTSGAQQGCVEVFHQASLSDVRIATCAGVGVLHAAGVLRLERLEIEPCAVSGLRTGTPARASVALALDLHIRGGQTAIYAEGGQLDARRVLLDEPSQYGIDAVGAEVALTDLYTAKTGRTGVRAVGGHLTLLRYLALESQGGAIDARASVNVLRDVTSLRSVFTVDPIALAIQPTIVVLAPAIVERVSIDRPSPTGIGIAGTGTVALSDLHVTGTFLVPDDLEGADAGHGLNVTGAASVNASRVTIEDTRRSAIIVLQQGKLALHDARLSGSIKFGIEINGGGGTHLLRGTLTNNRVGINLDNGELTVEDVVIEGDPLGDIGIKVRSGMNELVLGSPITTILRLSEFVVRNQRSRGLDLDASADTYSIKVGLVERNTVGLFSPAGTILGFGDDVVFRENGVDREQ